MTHPGLIVLLGSGETSPSGRKVLEQAMRRMPAPPQVALLETPAGFELNSDKVIGRVADFITHRLQNYAPQVSVIPARRRLTKYSPDDPELIRPLYQADLIFMGPGSPSYAVRQLRESRAWDALLARHRLGATMVFASAAVVAISLFALPVYEIYKVGEDLHWKPGLDFFGMYGLPLIFIPHWNNNDGGAELDTSRCFMGQIRFAELMTMLPPELTIVGIDEKTALIMDPNQGVCHVSGHGGVTLIHIGPEHSGASSQDQLSGTGLGQVAEYRGSHIHQFNDGESFSLSRIGNFHYPVPGAGISQEIWQEALRISQIAPAHDEKPSAEVLNLVEARKDARSRKDWLASDQLRDQIASLGWMIQDTPDGQQVSKKPT